MLVLLVLQLDCLETPQVLHLVLLTEMVKMALFFDLMIQLGLLGLCGLLLEVVE